MSTTFKNKTKQGSKLTLTGALRKLSYVSSATRVLKPNERSDWYWKVIHRAEVESTHEGSTDRKRFIDVIIEECNKLLKQEEKKNVK